MKDITNLYIESIVNDIMSIQNTMKDDILNYSIGETCSIRIYENQNFVVVEAVEKGQEQSPVYFIPNTNDALLFEMLKHFFMKDTFKEALLASRYNYVV